MDKLRRIEVSRRKVYCYVDGEVNDVG